MAGAICHWRQDRESGLVPHDDCLIRTCGEVAAVTALYEQNTIYGGAMRSGRYVFTEVWVCREGRWQLALLEVPLEPREWSAQGLEGSAQSTTEIRSGPDGTRLTSGVQ